MTKTCAPREVWELPVVFVEGQCLVMTEIDEVFLSSDTCIHDPRIGAHDTFVAERCGELVVTLADVSL